MRLIQKPEDGEFAAYAIQYIGLLPDDGRVLEYLQANVAATRKLVVSLPEERLLFRYAQGKWSIKEIVQHISDDERIYAYRALRFARADATELPGFEQDDYTRSANADERPVDELLSELDSVRASTIALFEGLPDDSLVRSGVASGHRMSVRAIAYHIAGHELRHANIIRERYL